MSDPKPKTEELLHARPERETHEEILMAQESLAEEFDPAQIVARAHESLKKAGEEALVRADNLDAALEFKREIGEVNNQMEQELEKATAWLNEQLTLKETPQSADFADIEVSDEELRLADAAEAASETLVETGVPSPQEQRMIDDFRQVVQARSDANESIPPQTETISINKSPDDQSVKAYRNLSMKDLMREGIENEKKVQRKRRIKGELPSEDQALLARATERGIGEKPVKKQATPRTRQSVSLSTVARPKPPKPKETEDTHIDPKNPTNLAEVIAQATKKKRNPERKTA